MAIGEIKRIACLNDREAEKVVESTVLTPHGREYRLDIYKIPSTESSQAIYVFTSNGFMQAHGVDKRDVLAQMAYYMFDTCKI